MSKIITFSTSFPSYHQKAGKPTYFVEERGIIICKEWLESPAIFVNWGLNNGWEKGLQIDREINDGNYEPSNCRFVTRTVNLANRRPYKKK